MKFIFILNLLFSATITYGQNLWLNCVLIPDSMEYDGLMFDLFKEGKLVDRLKPDNSGKADLYLIGSGVYLLQLKFADTAVYSLKVTNRLYSSVKSIPVEIDLSEFIRSHKAKSTISNSKVAGGHNYELSIDKKGRRSYFKNGKPISRLTFEYETNRKKIKPAERLAD